MAVFTTFPEASLARYLVMYELGELHAYRAIEAGIENSNYFVTLENEGELTEYVLTITESLSFDEVPFFNELMSNLARSGLPVPDPLRTLDGMSSTIFCGKPTWLFPKLPGSHPLEVTTDQCHTIGKHLASLHKAATGLRYSRSNPYNSAWLDATLRAQKNRLAPDELTLLQQIASRYARMEPNAELPRGIIHGDLFRDNALFVEDRLTGIIDFYHACEDFLVQDIAITMNDWCVTATGNTCQARRQALLKGYQSVRVLEDQEKNCLIDFQLFAALRFSLTRFLSGDENNPLKDPQELINIARKLSNLA